MDRTPSYFYKLEGLILFSVELCLILTLQNERYGLLKRSGFKERNKKFR